MTINTRELDLRRERPSYEPRKFDQKDACGVRQSCADAQAPPLAGRQRSGIMLSWKCLQASEIFTMSTARVPAGIALNHLYITVASSPCICGCSTFLCPGCTARPRTSRMSKPFVCPAPARSTRLATRYNDASPFRSRYGNPLSYRQWHARWKIQGGLAGFPRGVWRKVVPKRRGARESTRSNRRSDSRQRRASGAGPNRRGSGAEALRPTRRGHDD